MSDDDEYRPGAMLELVGAAEPARGGHAFTADLPDEFFSRLVRVCDDVACAPGDLLAVMMNESGIRPDAHNPNGDASGLIQFMPFVLRNLGWTQGDAAFRKLSAAEQLVFVRRYFAPHKGRLANATAVYLATFLPALLPHASEPDFALVVSGGRLGWAYAPNLGFDRNHDGEIRVDELTYALSRATLYPRYVEAHARACQAMATSTPPPA